MKPILQSIAAKAPDGTPCCQWVGPAGSGHFVKMIHNGIEYGDMQLIAEAYWVMKKLLDLTNEEMADVFARWNEGKLRSYLIESPPTFCGIKTNPEVISLIKSWMQPDRKEPENGRLSMRWNSVCR